MDDMDRFRVTAQCAVSKARTGVLSLPHFHVETPVFMPVGTKGCMKGVLPEQMEALNVHILLGNTYHLGLKPDMQHVVKLNVWGCSLTDVSAVARCPNLQIFSASCNALASIKDLQHCSSLRELYVRENHIADLHDVTCLTTLCKLKVFWLEGNPCCDVFGTNLDTYRLFVLKFLPSLERLDNLEVTEEERQKAQSFIPDAFLSKTNHHDRNSGDSDRNDGEKRNVDTGNHYEAPNLEPPTGNAPPAPSLSFTVDSLHNRQSSSRSGVNSVSSRSKNSYHDGGSKSLKKSCPKNQRANVTTPNRLRNANILNAALSLVKELDGESLEILELDIQNRLNGLREIDD